MRLLSLSLVAGALLVPVGSVQACAACYGQSDSPMAAGMNWGILSLLGMIVVVLGGVGAFFIFLARRSASLAAAGAGAKPPAEPVAGLEPGPLLAVRAEQAESDGAPAHARLVASACWPKPSLAAHAERHAPRTPNRS